MTDEMKKALAIFDEMVQRRLFNTEETYQEAYDHVMAYLLGKTKVKP